MKDSESLTIAQVYGEKKPLTHKELEINAPVDFHPGGMAVDSFAAFVARLLTIELAGALKDTKLGENLEAGQFKGMTFRFTPVELLKELGVWLEDVEENELSQLFRDQHLCEINLTVQSVSNVRASGWIELERKR